MSAALAAPATSRKNSSGDKELTFEKNIRPILKAHCFDCHGEGEKLKGGLDLRLRRLMVQGGDSGAAIVPGKPDKSYLFERVSTGEMPKRDKKLSAAEIATIRTWIAAGAKTAREEPKEIGKGMEITPEERAHWSFQPIRRPPVPKFRAKDRARTSIDALLLSKLSERKLSFSADADRVTLIRRVYLDLIGIPPAPDEVTKFLADESPEAYEKLLDNLLASPRYGERWGRHWLDAAGYADSDGYTDADTPRDYAYKYRDYVIRSFNADKPFNQFIIEQLAGDELALLTHTNLALFRECGDVMRDARLQEQLVATGFLRMSADGTATAGVDQDLARNAVVADAIKIVSTSLLGLSVGCAQCHDHRYDPIPQTDYYRLRALFEPAYDWKNWRTPAQRLISLYTSADRAKAAEVEAEAQKLATEKEAKQKQYIEEALTKHLEKYEADLRAKLRAAFDTPADKRTEEQKSLLKDNPSVNINSGVLYQYNQKAADELKAMDAKIGEIRARKPAEDFIQALTEIPGPAPVTHLFHRGDPKQPKEAVPPGALSIFAPFGQHVSFAEKDASLPTTGRRLAFARWLTSDEQPLLARVMVNRVWMHHFGRGLVNTPADFGFMGEKPSHPELLDWLASAFVTPVQQPFSDDTVCMNPPLTPTAIELRGQRRVGRSVPLSQRSLNARAAAARQARPSSSSPPPEGLGVGSVAKDSRNFSGQDGPQAGLDWSLKRLHKLIMMSTVYRQSSLRDPKQEKVDPDNTLYWRKPVHRLDAEAIRDSILATSGVLNTKTFGPPVPVREDVVGQIVVGIDKKEGDNKMPVEVPMGGEEFRRSVYIQVRRSRPLALLNTFDSPVMEVNCERRQSSTVATQALMLMNSEFILQQAVKFAERLRKEAGVDTRDQIKRAWQLAFSRSANEDEIHQSLDFLIEQVKHLKTLPEKPTTDTNAKKSAKQPNKIDPELQALTNLCQALLSANEFLYVD